jgi:hypothetical protein
MASTEIEFSKDVLLKLVKIDANDDPSAEDHAYITRMSKMELAQLRKRQIAYWTSNSIPDEVYNSYVAYISKVVGPQFGVAFGQADVDAAREQLATDAKPRFTGAQMKSDYPVVVGNRFDFTRGY